MEWPMSVFSQGQPPIVRPNQAVASQASATPATIRTFFTNFSLFAPENPISENGAWTNTSTFNAKISTITGPPVRAVGNQTGDGTFSDSYAFLSGFRPNVRAQGTVYKNLQFADNNGGHEVELLFHMHEAGGKIFGYECNFSSGGFYAQIVRWDGIGSASQPFTVLADAGVITAPVTGDIVRATIINGVITTYINRIAGGGFVQLATATDTTYTNGNPGFAMWLGGPPAVVADQPNFAFTDYYVTEI